MTDASGMTTYTYTDRDQVATKQTPQGTLTYTYNPGGDVLTTVSSNANGTDVAYAYDGNNRLASVTDNRTGGTTTYIYDATNQVDFFTYANGVKHDFAYDDRDRITDLDLTLASSPLASYSLNYSDSGRIDDVAENSGRNTNLEWSAPQAGFREPSGCIHLIHPAPGGISGRLSPAVSRHYLECVLVLLGLFPNNLKR